MIGVLTYNVPHQKTYDVLSLLKAKGYKDVIIYGRDLYYQKKYAPLLEHRPELTQAIPPDILCRNLEYSFVRCESEKQYGEIMLPHGSVVLYCGAGILPAEIIEKYRIVNAHPGYIPIVRGLDSLKWAILEGKPIGVSTHLIGEEVDAGYLIERKTVKIKENDTFHALAYRIYWTEINMLIEAIEKVDNVCEYVEPGVHVLHKRMPHELEKTLLAKFEERKREDNRDGIY